MKESYGLHALGVYYKIVSSFLLSIYTELFSVGETKFWQ